MNACVCDSLIKSEESEVLKLKGSVGEWGRLVYFSLFADERSTVCTKLENCSLKMFCVWPKGFSLLDFIVPG